MFCAQSDFIQFLQKRSLFLLKQARLNNYADDNTLSYVFKPMSDLVRILENESNVVSPLLEQNKKIANPEIFHVLLITKSQENTSG